MKKLDATLLLEWLKGFVTSRDIYGYYARPVVINEEHLRIIKDAVRHELPWSNGYPWQEDTFYFETSPGDTGLHIGDFDRAHIIYADSCNTIVRFEKGINSGEWCPLISDDLAPVDRSARCTTDGKPLDTTPGPNGQQQNYVILCDEERAKGFVRPVRRTYIHVGVDPEMQGIVLIKPGWTIEKKGVKACGTRTTMGQSLAETYARDPSFYTGTYCATCDWHFPVGEFGEFVWEGTVERVGT